MRAPRRAALRRADHLEPFSAAWSCASRFSVLACSSSRILRSMIARCLVSPLLSVAECAARSCSNACLRPLQVAHHRPVVLIASAAVLAVLCEMAAADCASAFCSSDRRHELILLLRRRQLQAPEIEELRGVRLRTRPPLAAALHGGSLFRRVPSATQSSQSTTFEGVVEGGRRGVCERRCGGVLCRGACVHIHTIHHIFMSSAAVSSLFLLQVLTRASTPALGTVLARVLGPEWFAISNVQLQLASASAFLTKEGLRRACHACTRGVAARRSCTASTSRGYPPLTAVSADSLVLHRLPCGSIARAARLRRNRQPGRVFIHSVAGLPRSGDRGRRRAGWLYAQANDLILKRAVAEGGRPC